LFWLVGLMFVVCVRCLLWWV